MASAIGLGLLQLVGCDAVEPACTPHKCRVEFSIAHECRNDYCVEVEKPAAVDCEPVLEASMTLGSSTATRVALLGVLIDTKNPNQSNARFEIVRSVVRQANEATPSLKLGLLKCSYAVTEVDANNQRILADISDYLTRLGVAVVIGPSSSYAARLLLTSDLPARSPDFVMISPSATLADLQERDRSERLFRTTPADTAQIETLVDVIEHESHLQAILPVVQRDAYGRSLSEAITARVHGERIRKRFEFADLGKDGDRDNLAVELDLAPDALLVVARDGTQIAKLFEFLIEHPQYEPERIFVADGAANDPTMAPVLEQECDEGTYCLRDHVIGTRPQTSGQETFVLPGGGYYSDDYVPFVHDAAWLAVYALHYSHAHGAPGINPAEVRSALAHHLQMSSVGTAPQKVRSDQTTILDEITEPDFVGLDLTGYSGPLDFDAEGDVSGAFELWHLIGGKRETYTPATENGVLP